MSEREQANVLPEQPKQLEGVDEADIPNQAALRELGFDDGELQGARILEARRVQLLTHQPTKADFEALRAWNQLGKSDPDLRRLQALFEQKAALSSLESPQARAKATAFLRRALSLRAQQGTVGEFLFDVGHQLLGDEFPPSESVARQVNALKKEEIVAGHEVKPIEALTSPGMGMATRLDWLQKKVAPALHFVRWLDRKQQAQAPEQPDQLSQGNPPESPTPPSKTDEHIPSMEQAQRREESDKDSPHYVVSPGRPGFYETESFQRWDGKKWTKASTQDVKYSPRTKKGGQTALVHGVVAEDMIPIPLQQHGLFSSVVIKESLDQLRRNGFRTSADFAGHVYIAAPKGQGIVAYDVQVAEGELRKYSKWYEKTIQQPDLSQAPTEVTEALRQIQAETVEPLERAHRWQEFVQHYLTYSNDPKWNTVYVGSGDYFTAVAKGRMADCDVANTFFLLGCSTMGVSGELAGGYEVSKLEDEEARLRSGDLHAISKIYDPKTKELVPFDATPPQGGKDQSEQEEGEGEGDEKGEGESDQQKPGEQKKNGEPKGDESQSDALDQMAQTFSDDEIDEMKDEFEEAQMEKRDEQRRQEEAKLFADETGCSEEEAREVLDGIREALDMKDQSNERIIDRLFAQFKRIIQQRTLPRSMSMPSVPRSEGENLIDVVEASISLRSGDPDPGGFSREVEVAEKLEYYGGFRLVIVNDMSGSVESQIDVSDSSSPTGKRLTTVFEEQRRVNFIILEALDRFKRMIEQRRGTLLMPFDVETEIMAFSGAGPNARSTITISKPLSTELTNRDRLGVWKTLSQPGGWTPDHQALRHIRESLTPQDLDRLQRKDLLMIVIVNADGGSDSPTQVQAELKQLRKLGVIVKGRGITSGGQQMEATYAPDGSWGEVDSYPDFVAHTVIPEIKKLAPKRIGVVR